MLKKLFITLLFGALMGVSITLYTYGLEQIQVFHKTEKLYPLALVFVFGLIYFIKRNTLFFPTQVSQVIGSSELEQRHWSPFSFFWNMIGSWLSHLAGASLGREGTVLVLAGSLAQVCKLNWTYYKPIILAAAFACVIGEPFIAVIFIIEMFSTSIDQKIFSFFMAWMGFLVLKSLGSHPLLNQINVDLTAHFIDKILVVLSIGLSVGLMTKIFKYSYRHLLHFFSKNIIYSILFLAILSWIFIQPFSKPFHSLSLESFSKIQTGQAEIYFVFFKSIFTLVCMSLGFIGGDFVPSIGIGSATGVLWAEFFQVPWTFGLTMGLMAFFTGLTRLKWTSVWILFFLGGFKVMLWGYLCLSMTRQFCGSDSLYKKSEGS